MKVSYCIYSEKKILYIELSTTITTYPTKPSNTIRSSSLFPNSSFLIVLSQFQNSLKNYKKLIWTIKNYKEL